MMETALTNPIMLCATFSTFMVFRGTNLNACLACTLICSVVKALRGEGPIGGLIPLEYASQKAFTKRQFSCNFWTTHLSAEKSSFTTALLVNALQLYQELMKIQWGS